jgi:outer membrane murein-binding lipoprotein Lpp
MKSLLMTLGAIYFGTLFLAACTGNPQQDAAAVQGYVVAFQPLASEIACTAQEGANLAGEIASAQGDAGGAQTAGIFSKANGSFCNGLKAGAPLPQPVTIPLPPAALGAAPAIVPKPAS